MSLPLSPLWNSGHNLTWLQMRRVFIGWRPYRSPCFGLLLSLLLLFGVADFTLPGFCSQFVKVVAITSTVQFPAETGVSALLRSPPAPPSGGAALSTFPAALGRPLLLTQRVTRIPAPATSSLHLSQVFRFHTSLSLAPGSHPATEAKLCDSLATQE